MVDTNLIATLIATRTDFARRAFQLDHNKDRYRPPTSAPEHFISGGKTPRAVENPEDKEDSAHRLELTFDKPPKNVNDGFVFGCDPDCDIRLVDRTKVFAGEWQYAMKVSRRHFSITFDADRRVILRDTSTYGTIVSYDGQAQNEVRTGFTWIILSDAKTIEVSIPGADLSFKVKLGTHQDREKEFFVNVDKVFAPSKQKGEGGLAKPMQQLEIPRWSPNDVPPATAIPHQTPIYLLRDLLGRGGCGMVNKVIDVSTGRVFAGKSFFQPKYNQEVAIMRKVKHDHLVRFVDFHENPTPLLVMEYMPLGNLDVVHSKLPFALEETRTILCQGLQAVEYLHSQGVAHRDIKPANMLLSCRSPLAIKLADFGLAKHNRDGLTEFKTCAGTRIYTAPEVFEGNPYNFSIDIWSLGVVALKLANGLPQVPDPFVQQKWCDELVRSGQNLRSGQKLRSDELIGVILGSMLHRRPSERPAPSECLDRALNIGKAVPPPQQLPTSTASQNGSTTPHENASVLTTLRLWPDTKRQQSLASGSHADFGKETLVRKERDDSNTSVRLSTCDIANASLFFSGQYGPVYESILKLLKTMQVNSDRATDPDPFAHVQNLCRQIERMRITQIVKHIDLDAEQTILTAVTKAKRFTLASLTSSDLSNSVADLADHLYRILEKLDDDPETLSNHHVRCLPHEDGGETVSGSSIRNLLRPIDRSEDEIIEGARTPMKASAFSEAEKNPTCSKEDGDHYQSPYRD